MKPGVISQDDLRDTIVKEFAAIANRGIVVQKIFSFEEEGVTIFFIVVNAEKIDIGWYDIFSDIELYVGEKFDRTDIEFRYATTRGSHNGIVPASSTQIF